MKARTVLAKMTPTKISHNQALFPWTPTLSLKLHRVLLDLKRTCVTKISCLMFRDGRALFWECLNFEGFYSTNFCSSCRECLLLRERIYSKPMAL
ncbi:hypothetical protein ACB092_08G115700 [Castanea dentata]